MRDNPKVVSFDRSAEYLHHRAMMNRRDNRIIDALELMRQAVEASPDNAEYRLDLAELYCELEYHAQSASLLLDMLAKPDAPDECYYGLALNQLGMNDVSGARHSLNLYRSRDPEGAHNSDAGDLLNQLSLYENMMRPDNRRLYRAMRTANRACEAMKANQPEKACRLFRASLEKASEQFEMRALCVCAQVYAMLGDSARANELMNRAEAEHPEGTDLLLMIHAAGEMKLHDRAAEYARLALQQSPYDRELLHIRGVAMKRAGAQDREAAACWERILRIDPEDDVAAFYQSVAANNRLDQYTLEFAYEVPDEEYLRRIRELSTRMSEGFDAIRECWASEPGFRELVRWAGTTGDMRLGRLAISTLAMLEDEDATRMLRKLMCIPTLDKELKLHAAVLVKLQGRPLEEILPGPLSAMGDALVDTERLLGTLPVGERQLVRFADEVLEREYDISATAALALMWANYRRTRMTHGDPLKRVEPAAAALCYNLLLQNGQKPEIHRLARQFGCTPRQLVFCARRIAAGLDRQESQGE